MKAFKILIICIQCIFFTTLSIGQCIQESHSPFKNQGWQSCNTANSPFSERGNKHWIMYDLGSVREILDLRIWNHNTWGETGMGVKSIVIDYSNDQKEWSSVGPFDIEEAPGSWKYVANEAIDFEDFSGRYVIITVLETWDKNSACAGISEIKMNLGTVTSIDEEDLGTEVSVYPNPAIDFINVELPNTFNGQQITITNQLGQIIIDKKTFNHSNNKINIANLEDGIYNISIRNEETIIAKSFVKMNY